MPYTAIGFAFGTVLWIVGFGAIRAGHGAYIPLSVFGAPLSLIPVVGLFAAPFQWAWIGWALRQDSARQVLAIHVAGVLFTLALDSFHELGGSQRGYRENALMVIPGPILAGYALYLIGQVLAWGMAIGRSGTGRVPADVGE